MFLKKGGEIFLHFPDYRSTFEARYRLPWIPLFPRLFARVYLRMLGKPLLGLSSINYVTKKNVMLLLRQNDTIELTDLDKVFFQRRTKNIIKRFNFKKIGQLGKVLVAIINLIHTYFYAPIRRAFRSEKSVTILVRKL